MATTFTSIIAKRINWIWALAAIITSISGCTHLMSDDIVRYADKTTYIASEHTLRTINRTFYASFSVGDWHYQGAKVKYGQVNAYIRIPQKLDMPADIQQQYLQKVICPKDSDIDLWHQLKNINLEVHIYTQIKTQSISATCINPLRHAAQA